MTTTTSRSNQLTALNVSQFKALCHSAQWINLVKAVLFARVHASITRKKVDAYIAPVFAPFEFYTDRDYATKHERITKPDSLYLSTDEEQCARFYAACDEAHKAHGFDLPAGYCPALVAEHAVITAENALIKATTPAFGVDSDAVYGTARKEWLDLIIGATIKGQA